MTRAAWAWAATAGVTLAAGAGCHQSPAYPPAYGGGYPAGAYPMAPAGAYPAPAGAYPAPGGSYVVPGASVPGSSYPSYPSPTPAGPALSPTPDIGPAPSTYAPGVAPGGASGGVPNYSDPNAGDFDFGTPPPGNGGSPRPSDGFPPPNGGNTSSPFYPSGAVPRPFGAEQAARPLPAGSSQDYFAGLDEFGREPRPAVPSDLADAGRPTVSPAGFQEPPRDPPVDFGFDPVTSPARPAAAPAAATNGQLDESGFGYDRAGYGWLRGVVDFDPQRKNWHVIYGVTPDPADRFQGSLTLLDDGRLADFRDSDVVHLEGRIDPAAGRDALGKPMFRVTKAELIGRFE